MNVKLFSDESFTSILGELIKSLRIKMGYTQDTLAHSICSRTTLNKIENGKIKIVDIDIALKLVNKLGVPFDELVNQIFSLQNSGHKVLETLFRHLNDCDFDAAHKYYLDASIQDTLKTNPKIGKYYLSACLFRDEKYNDIITLLQNEIKQLPETLSIMDIMLVNCYILSYLSINYKDEEKIAALENIISIQRKSIDFYLDYCPEILIRMIVNLVDYYRIANYIDEALNLLDKAENYCKKLNLYDSMFDVYFNRLIIDIQYFYGKNAIEYFHIIDSYFKLLNKKFKKIYIQKKYNFIKSLYETFYDKKYISV